MIPSMYNIAHNFWLLLAGRGHEGLFLPVGTGMIKYFPAPVFAALLFCSCSSLRQPSVKDDGKIELMFVQVNDVYEIAPVSGGAHGGMARIATIKKELKRSNPNVFLTMAGDFLSPSVYNSLQHEGKRIRGRQMVDAMNAAGFDLVAFGNHEFDITEEELQSRLNESSFKWIASNVFHKSGDSVVAFKKVRDGRIEELPVTLMVTVSDADGTRARIGLIGATITSNNADYVKYADPVSTAVYLYNQIKDSCDAVIALTHQTLGEDIRLAEAIPGLALIMGGHEHDGRFKKTGNTFITKAHANARTAYITRLRINKTNKVVEVIPELRELDEKVKMDSSTTVVVKKWMDIADENYSALGFDPKDIILSSGDSLDGREAIIRRGPTNFTSLIVSAMAEACPAADMVIMNAGSIRLDDVLYPPISQYDILRSLPFGGSIREVDMKGELLKKVLDTGLIKNRTRGSFLHYYPVRDHIEPEAVYRVALTDFLLKGLETNLRFLNKDNPGILKVYDEAGSPADPRSDIRLAIIRFLQKKKRF